MAEIIKKVKVMQNNGTFTDYIPLGADATNIKTENGYNLQETIGNIDVNTDGNIAKQLNNTSILTSLNFRKDNSLTISTTDLYNGISYDYLQGFCEVNGNIIMGLYNATHENNYVKLVEFDPNDNNNIIRSEYLILNHCNSISYNEKDNKLYIASCAKYENGVEIIDNSIIVVDYETFSITKTIIVSNIPNGKRIRSVYYDNDNNIFYATDRFDVFIIDEDNERIIDTIELDTSGLDSYITSQTLKRYKNMFVGLYMTYIAFWTLNGTLIKIINIDRYNEGEKIGEPEDFILYDNDDIVIGSIKKLANYRDEREIQFYKSNLKINNNNKLRPSMEGSEDGSIVLYVDNTSTDNYENGQEEHPFKDLQTAVNIAKNTKEFVTIRILGSNYGFCSIAGCNKLELSIRNNITIDGLRIWFSNVSIAPTSTKKLTLNGLSCVRSSVIFRGIEDNKSIINYFDNDQLDTANGRCVHSVFSKINLALCKLNGNDSNPIANIAQHSDVTFDRCDFDDYNNTYALDINSLSKVILNRNTFAISPTSSQHTVRLVTGSVLHTQPNLNNYDHYILSNKAKLYGTSTLVQNISDIYYGEICNVNTEFDMIRLKVKEGGTTDVYKYIDIPTTATRIPIETTYMYSGGLNVNVMILRINNGVLEITEHRRLFIASTFTYNYEQITNTPVSTQDYSCISGVEYYDL